MSNWQTTPGVMKLTKNDTFPFMAQKEYEYIRDLINKEGFKTALEWGAGASSIWFPGQCPNITLWLAVESDPVYHDYLINRLPENAIVCLMQSREDYINIEEKFDFILVDGLYRDECLKKAFTLLSNHPHSQIILHDSGRKEYKKWYSKNPHKIIFEGEGWLGDGWDHRGLTAFGNYE